MLSYCPPRGSEFALALLQEDVTAQTSSLTMGCTQVYSSDGNCELPDSIETRGMLPVGNFSFETLQGVLRLDGPEVRSRVGGEINVVVTGHNRSLNETFGGGHRL